MMNCSRHRSVRLLGIALAASALLGLSGCGGNGGPHRYELSGSVAHDGKPIPAGTILFEPDTSHDNDGPGILVEFTDGHYRTPSGKGTVGGPHIVRIVGYDGEPQSEMPQGKPLFREYQLQIDLPRHNARQDFDVPAGHQ